MEELSKLVKELEIELERIYGSPILSSEDLRTALGYKSMSALRKAIYRKKCPVPVFKLENRRGNYALIKDVAAYLAKKRSEPND